MAPVLRQTLVCTCQKQLLATVGLDVELRKVLEHVVENHCFLDVLRSFVSFFVANSSDDYSDSGGSTERTYDALIGEYLLG